LDVMRHAGSPWKGGTVVWWRVRASNALMAVAGFLWGALRFLLQTRASLAGGASEPAGQAQPEERGREGVGAG
jgi:hypothetical protein